MPSTEAEKKASDAPAAVLVPELPKETVVEKAAQPPVTQAKEDDKKKPVAQVLAEATPTPANAVETKAPPATAKMPTVVTSMDTNKLNTLPDASVVAESKVAAAEPPKKVEEPVVVVKATPLLDCWKATIVKNFWTPENKDLKNQYNNLLSLKDKKLSKQFPDVLYNFSELAITEQRVNLKDTWIPL